MTVIGMGCARCRARTSTSE